MIDKYLKTIGWKRIIVMLLGNVFLGMGVSIFKFSCLGNDAFNGMLMSLAECTGIEYARFFVIFSIGLFIIEFLTGKKYIGIGTIINTFLLGYIVTFFYEIWNAALPAPDSLISKIFVMLSGVVIGSMGISMYQRPDAGVSPYDSLSLILAERFQKIPYFWWRMLTDGICAGVCYLTGGLVGLGTLTAAFGFGPVIHFFNIHLTDKLLKLGTGYF